MKSKKTVFKNAVFYGRVSTEEQASHGYSLEMQKKQCEEWNQRRGNNRAQGNPFGYPYQDKEKQHDNTENSPVKYGNHGTADQNPLAAFKAEIQREHMTNNRTAACNQHTQ